MDIEIEQSYFDFIGTNIPSVKVDKIDKDNRNFYSTVSNASIVHSFEVSESIFISLLQKIQGQNSIRTVVDFSVLESSKVQDLLHLQDLDEHTLLYTIRERF